MAYIDSIDISEISTSSYDRTNEINLLIEHFINPTNFDVYGYFADSQKNFPEIVKELWKNARFRGNINIISTVLGTIVTLNPEAFSKAMSLKE
ncbi:hypothetical protein DEO72_LG2g4251 [Vigna unguiculata]|uniref:Uncharacterized protein n=1 Tax=Vigna unguiculata TaxID=3917 RepID=A0A4D6L5U2_VIGUN|nr:hypothetical protein DEO72_LG2g4251 [Vigna unguiculata]